MDYKTGPEKKKGGERGAIIAFNKEETKNINNKKKTIF